MANNNAGQSANGTRGPRGQFAKGNPGGPGNPLARRVERLRKTLLEAVTKEDMREVILKLVEMAKGGDLKAIDLLLNRTLGKVESGPVVAVQMNQSPAGEGNFDAESLRTFLAGRIARIGGDS